MPGLYESEIEVKQRVVDGVFNLNSKETPFLSQLKDGGRTANILCTNTVDEYGEEQFDGVMEGADVTAFDKEVREKVQAYCQILRTSWGITDLADVTGIEHMPAEKGTQRMKALIRLKRKMAFAAAGVQDTRLQSGQATSYRMRGAFSWLDPAAQGVLPVPAGYRPASQFAGVLDDWKPSELEALLAAASEQISEPVVLQGHVGIALKGRMSTWGQRDEEASSGELARQVYNLDGAKKELLQVVDRFVFDAGTVFTIPNFNLARNIESGAATDYTSRSGIFVIPKMWVKRFMLPFVQRDLPDLGGGPRGYAKCIGGVFCRNSRGQFRVLISADSD